jgi:hypothetical protein
MFRELVLQPRLVRFKTELQHEFYKISRSGRRTDNISEGTKTQRHHTLLRRKG